MGAGVLTITSAAVLVLTHLGSSPSANRPRSPSPVLPTPQRVDGVRLLATWKGAALFDQPEALAFDRSGRAYVADYSADRIAIVDSSGQPGGSLGAPGNGRAQFSGPSGVAVDDHGYVYVADSNNSRILKLSSAGKQVHPWGSYGGGRGQFDGPHDVAVDAKRDIYVTDFGHNRIQEFAPPG
jgi:DNA-binding beta-propeller fold protein YncE